ncbi:PRC-barrel domain containing protein [Sphaerisporangium sp. NPDC049003]|uniref:PRC-barrel domain containing protein n=1 Tax=Sphaerisporangium sp. NPDC049003 TaxID=3364517 RepID=UPI003721EDD6
MTEAWTYRDGVAPDPDLSLIDYDVEATDGKIGSVEEESNVDGDSYLVVDIGFWLFGRKALVPASLVTRVDPEANKIYLARAQDEIENAPEFDEDTYTDVAYRRRVGDYYSSFSYAP